MKKRSRNAGYGWTLALATVMAGALSAPELPAAEQAPSSWTFTYNLQTARRGHTSTLLPDGRVLVAGGVEPNSCSTTPTSSSELYDPVARGWVSAGALNTARSNHTATLLQSEKVLVVGNETSQTPLNSSELYDPVSRRWRQTGSFNQIRKAGAATLLTSGKVLVVGDSLPGRISAELYDPVDENWSVTDAPSFVPSIGHTVLLPGGKVLAVSEGSPWDYGDLSVELYDPATGRWSSAGSLGLFWAPTVTLLRDGRVLVTGLAGANFPTQSAVYDSKTSRWSATRPLNTYRHYGGYTATLLSTGQVLVAGGVDYPSGQPVSFDELFDPASGTWTPTSALNQVRQGHTATLLRNGQVLAAGGAPGINCDAPLLSSAELYDSGITPVPNPTEEPGIWTLQNAQGNVSSVTKVVMDPANRSLMYAATPTGIFKTTSGGVAWSRADDLLDAEALAIDPRSPEVVYSSNRTTARKTTDGGVTWSEIRPNPGKLLGARAFAIDPSNPSTLYAALREDGLSKSTDSGSTFSYINSGLTLNDFYYGFDSTALAIDSSQPSTLFAGGTGIYTSTNSGGEWKARSAGLALRGVSGLVVDPSQSALVYVATFSDGFYRSSDRGEVWERLQNGLPKGVTFSDVVIDPTEGRNLYVSTLGAGVFRSNDHGENWSSLSEGLLSHSVNSLTIDSSGRFLAAATDVGVFTLSIGAPRPCSRAPQNVSVSFRGPLSGCTQSNSRVCSAQEAISFTALSLTYTFATCDRFAWSFGDGTALETLEPSISHQFAAGVPRTVTLTVTNEFGKATASALDVSPANATSCVTSSSQACLNGGRYAVTLNAVSRDQKNFAAGQVTRQTDLFGYFSLPALTGDPSNPEVFVKIAGPIHGAPLVFYSGLTDLEYFVNVLDVQTGVLRRYHVPAAANPTVSSGDYDFAGIAHASICSNTVRTTTTETPGSCTPDANTLCLLNNRFRLSVVGRDDPARTGKTAAGVATAVSGKPFGFFSFPALTNDPTNLEVFVKMIDATSVDGHFWVFFGGLTDVEFTLKVTDTTTGKTQTYLKPLFSTCGLNDTTGFP